MFVCSLKLFCIIYIKNQYLSVDRMLNRNKVIQTLLQQFISKTIKHIYRETNKAADKGASIQLIGPELIGPYLN